jgi:hypothetical protein
VDIICPDGLGICTDKECSVCGVNLHSFCAAESFREMSDIVADANIGIVLWSVSCFHFSKIEAFTSDIVKMQQAELLKKKKKQLKNEAQELNVKINCRINGVSHDASKEFIVACWRKNMIQLCPSFTGFWNFC